MLLAIDIGNTNIVIGLFSDGALQKHWRIATDKGRSADEYGLAIKSFFSAAGMAVDIKGAIIASVVPPLDPVFRGRPFETPGR
jgi:type III pantothenate kinase